MITIKVKGKYAGGGYTVHHNGKVTPLPNFDCVTAFLHGVFLGEGET